jgi:ribosome biogenesis GTPase A
MNTHSDLQCQAILKGLRDLEGILNRPLADTALDLKENASTSRQKDLLIRLRKSLVQYLERTGELVYIALIGHFSSGKSSTINSLLNLWNSSAERPVGLNPTDNTITLITHEKNTNSLLKIARFC